MKQLILSITLLISLTAMLTAKSMGDYKIFIGIRIFAYDIWGDTVNTASRMESSGEVGRVNISEATYALIKDHFHCTSRGKVKAKNKGEIEMYFVEFS